MITLYRSAACDSCDDVQETLRELVVAHQVVDIAHEHATLSANGAADAIPVAILTGELPTIADGERLVQGEQAVRAYLVELAHELEAWRKFQIDACYIDDKGKTC
jgi:glutaredoxin